MNGKNAAKPIHAEDAVAKLTGAKQRPSIVILREAFDWHALYETSNNAPEGTQRSRYSRTLEDALNDLVHILGYIYTRDAELYITADEIAWVFENTNAGCYQFERMDDAIRCKEIKAFVELKAPEGLNNA